MKIWIVVTKFPRDNSVYVECDWIGDDPYEMHSQEVFFNKEQAKRILDERLQHKASDVVTTLHEFDLGKEYAGFVAAIDQEGGEE